MYNKISKKFHNGVGGKDYGPGMKVSKEKPGYPALDRWLQTRG